MEMIVTSFAIAYPVLILIVGVYAVKALNRIAVSQEKTTELISVIAVEVKSISLGIRTNDH